MHLGLGGQQIGQAFGLGQVDSAIGERAAGEFTGLGQSNPRLAAEDGKQGIDRRPAPMTLIFNDVLASCAMRRIKSEDQRLIDQATIRRIDQPAQRSMTRRRQRPRNPLGGGQRMRSTGPDNRHPRGRATTRQGGDRVDWANVTHQANRRPNPTCGSIHPS